MSTVELRVRPKAAALPGGKARRAWPAACLAVALALALPGRAQSPAPPAGGDARALVRFPEPVRLHTLANMREHLATVQRVDAALGQGAYDEAARLAEQRLGLSSLEAHGAAHLAPFMPQAMQEIGTRMHRAASRFAVEAQNAGASGDVRPALTALAGVLEQCVACHAAYRLQ
jgi:hypothetical protein